MACDGLSNHTVNHRRGYYRGILMNLRALVFAAFVSLSEGAYLYIGNSFEDGAVTLLFAPYPVLWRASSISTATWT